MSNDSGFEVEDGLDGIFGSVFDPAGTAMDAMTASATEVLMYARDNAPWADRTGAARNGLEVEVYEANGEVVLELYHTVDYGQWLETIQNGEFAIIMPTLERFAAEVFEAAGGRVIGTIGGGSE